ncbi:MAG TPA: alternate-type signal peptide domain-containing protein [Beutenbergiaceae bacterium]|nr:alternate-type signal peptide domain-containing protein [Beutenbergiaceae bacterium]
MNKKTKGMLAGAAGAAILIGGSTFALWSDSETVAGGEITAGNLDVALVGDPQWKDVSEDREDYKHSIDLADFRIIPGDTIQGTFAFDAALEGENMVADLSVAGSSEATNDFLEALDVRVSVDGEETDWDGTPITVQFASDDNGNPSGLDTLPAVINGDGQFEVTLTVTFDEDTPDQVLTQASTALGDISVGLDQVRSDAPGYDG